MRQPGIEPKSIAWKAIMLTITPLTQSDIGAHASEDPSRRGMRELCFGTHCTVESEPFCYAGLMMQVKRAFEFM